MIFENSPKPLELTASEEQTIIDHEEIFTANGFNFIRVRPTIVSHLVINLIIDDSSITS